MEFWRPLGTSKNRKIFDFGGQHGGKLAPKSKPKSMLSSKGVFLKKSIFLLEKLSFLRSSGSKLEQKSIKNRSSKRYGNRKARKLNFDSIFDRFGSHLGSPKRSQDAQKSMLNWHQNLIGFWRPLGTPFFQPRGAKMHANLPFWSRPGGMRGLRERVWEREAEDLMSGTWLWKDPEG